MGKAEIVLENIKTRRSIRKFTGQAVSDEDMNKILEAGRWAPSGANAQPWRFIVIKDRDRIQAISDASYYTIFKSRHVGEAAALVIIAGDPKAGSPTYVQDCTIAGTNMTLMAHAMGIGSCWIGAFEDKTIRDIVSMPEPLKIIALIAFGYQAREVKTTPRLSLNEIVYAEGYGSVPAKIALSRLRHSGPLSVLGQIIRVLINKR